jgi:sugar/nucleoside kinase (ribokinase family)
MPATALSTPVIGLGWCACDRIYQVDRYPAQGGKTRIRGMLEQGGGQVASALVALARLGHATRIVGKCGDDAEGARIGREFDAAGVDTRGLLVVPRARSQLSIILVPAAGGERTIFVHRGQGIDLAAADIAPALLPEAPYLLLIDGHELEACLLAATHCRARGGRVLLDAEYCEPRTATLLPLVDELVADEGFAARLLGSAAGAAPEAPATLAALLATGAGRVTVTLGARGAVSWDGRVLLRQRAFAVPIVDTTGAGDAFHAGIAHGLLAGLDFAATLRFACALAALKCRALGGRAGLPSLAEVEALLAEGTLRPE